jgi:thiamine transporter ThiT
MMFNNEIESPGNKSILQVKKLRSRFMLISYIPLIKLMSSKERCIELIAIPISAGKIGIKVGVLDGLLNALASFGLRVKGC